MLASGRSRRLGFTLVELLVTLALLGLAVAAVGTINYLHQRDTYENKLLTELQDEMRRTMETLVPNLRMGEGLDRSVANQYTVLVPEDVGSDYLFGYDPATQSVWQQATRQVICTRIAALQVSSPDAKGLVTLELVSLSTLPGVQHGLPLRLKTSVMLRNR